MESLPFLPASQPMNSTPSFIFPQLLQGPSSLELPPGWAGSQPRRDDATHFPDLKLSPNTSRILAESQASGRLPARFNGPAGQPVRTAKTAAAAKRTSARSHSQPNTWKAGSASACARGTPAPRKVSQLPEVAQPQPPPVKARARRAARVAKPSSRETATFVSQQPAITTPSWGASEQSASQHSSNPISAAQTVAPQAEATPTSMHTGPSAAAEQSAPSWGEGEIEHGESKSTRGLFSWATATAVEISQHCGLHSLPLDLVQQVLPRFRAHLKESGPSAGANTCRTSPAPIPAPAALALPSTSNMDRSELLPAAQLPGPFHATEQTTSFSLFECPATTPTTVALGTEPAYDLELWSMMDCSTWAPEPEPSTVAGPTADPQSRTLTYEELEALLRKQDGPVLVPTVEEPSAAPDFLLDLEHSRDVEAGREEYPFVPPTHEEVERSLCLPPNTHFSTEVAQDAGMGSIWTGGLDFGPLPDGWESWAEL